MEFGSLGGGEDGEHNGVAFVEISKTSFVEMGLFNRV